MGRRAREVQPWSSRAAATEYLVKKWGKTAFEEIRALALAIVAHLQITEQATRARALERALRGLSLNVRKVQQLVKALPIRWARSENPRRLEMYAELFRQTKDPACDREQVLKTLEQFDTLEKLVRDLHTFSKSYADKQGGSPRKGGKHYASSQPTFEKLEHQVLAAELGKCCNLTGSTLALLAISLGLEPPTKDDWDKRRRAWEARLKANRRNARS